jgi:hypothetical protein
MNDLEALAATVARMTEGKWTIARYVSSVVGRPLVASAMGRTIGNIYTFDAEAVANGDGIVALKNAAPALIAETQALRERVADEIANMRGAGYQSKYKVTDNGN